VFVVCGGPGVGVFGDVEPAGVVSAVTDEDGMKRSLRSCSADETHSYRQPSCYKRYSVNVNSRFRLRGHTVMKSTRI
jgi:hypothetical protein